MKTAIMQIQDIHPAPYNPRVSLTPNDDEWKSLSNSLEHFGMVLPLIVNERTGLLISGHQRLNVLKAQGKKEVEVVLVDYDDEQERLLNIALNKIDGDWDYGKLEELFGEISKEDIKFTGFTEDELSRIFDNVETASADDFDFDDDDEESESSSKEEPEEKPEKEFSIFLSFPSKEKAEAYLKDHGIDVTYPGTTRNITVKMEGTEFGTVN